MNKETIIELLTASKVKKDIQLHKHIEDFLLSHPEEYPLILGTALQKGKMKDIFFLLELEQYSFNNTEKNEPLHYLAKNVTLEKSQYEIIIQKILQRHEYINEDINHILAKVNTNGVGVFTQSIYHGNLYFLSLINSNNIDLSSSKPEFIYQALSHLKSSSFISTYQGTNSYIVRDNALKLLDKIKLPFYNTIKTDIFKEPLFSAYDLNNKKHLSGFKFYCEIFRKTNQIYTLGNHFQNTFSKFYESNLAYENKSTMLLNILSALVKEDLPSISAGSLLAYNLFNSKSEEFLTKPKIKQAIQNDPEFLKDFLKTMSSFHLNTQNRANFISFLKKTYSSCEHQFFDNEFLLELEGKNETILLFLLNEGHKIDYSNSHYTIVDNIMHYSDDFIISEERMKPDIEPLFIKYKHYHLDLYKPDYIKILENIDNIPSGTLARSCILMSNIKEEHKKTQDYKDDINLLLKIFEKSLFKKSISSNTSDDFKNEITKYFEALFEFSDDSLFENSGEKNSFQNSFQNYFEKQLFFTKDIIENNSNGDLIKIKQFLSAGLESYNKGNYYFKNKEQQNIFKVKVEKLLINLSLKTEFDHTPVIKNKKRL